MSDLRAYESLVIGAIATLEARARGNKIHYPAGPPDDAVGLEGDFALNKLNGDVYEFTAGTFVFLFNILPRANASQAVPTAQLLGIDSATGELLVLLSPNAPTDPAAYQLAELVAALGKAQGISDGNSLVYGQATSNPATKSWPAQLFTQLDSTKFGQPLVIAVSGQSTQDMLNRQQQYLFNQINTTAYGQLIVSVGGGANDLMSGVSPAQVKANRTQYIANIRAWQAAHGNFPVRVILESITRNGKQYGSITLQQYETYRQQLNQEALTGYHSVYGADYYANYDSAPELRDVTDTTYFDADHQHFNDAGQLVRARVEKPLWLAAQAGTALAPAPDYVPPAANPARRVFYADKGLVIGTGGTSWADQSGNGDVVSTTTTTGATLLANALNSLPALRLVSTPLTGSVAGHLAGAAPFQFLAVVRLDSNSDNLNLMGYGADPGVGGAIADMIVYQSKLVLHTLNAGNGTDGLNTVTAPAAPASGQFALVGVRHDGTNGYSYTKATGLSTGQPIYRASQPDSPLRIGGGHYDNTAGSDLHDGTADYAAVITNPYDDAQWAADIAALSTRYAL